MLQSAGILATERPWLRLVLVLPQVQIQESGFSLVPVVARSPVTASLVKFSCLQREWAAGRMKCRDRKRKHTRNSGPTCQKLRSAAEQQEEDLRSEAEQILSGFEMGKNSEVGCSAAGYANSSGRRSSFYR